VNGYIYSHRDKTGLPFVEAMLQEFGVIINTEFPGTNLELQLNGLKEMLMGRRLILAANHPLGGLDGLALMNQIGKARPDIVFPVNDLLMNVPGLTPLFIPINKHGKNTDNTKIIEETFAGNKIILYFPAGLVSRKFKGGLIKDLEWKSTFIKKARRYERDILPVYISGRNSDWFYNLAKWRKKLGIKTNLEMLYLVDEMMKQKDHTITIIIGKLISWQSFDKSRNDLQWAEFVKQKVYGLQK
jgi:putative hemolysin